MKYGKKSPKSFFKKNLLKILVAVILTAALGIYLNKSGFNMFGATPSINRIVNEETTDTGAKFTTTTETTKEKDTKPKIAFCSKAKTAECAALNRTCAKTIDGGVCSSVKTNPTVVPPNVPTTTVTAGYKCNSSKTALTNGVAGSTEIFCPDGCLANATSCTTVKSEATCGTIGNPVTVGSWAPSGKGMDGPNGANTERECVPCILKNGKGVFDLSHGARCSEVMGSGEKAVIYSGAGSAYTGLPSSISSKIAPCMASGKQFAIGQVDPNTNYYCGPNGGWIKPRDGKSAKDLYDEAMKNLCSSDESAGLAYNGSSSCVKPPAVTPPVVAPAAPEEDKKAKCDGKSYKIMSSTSYYFCNGKDAASLLTCPTNFEVDESALKSGKSAASDVCKAKVDPLSLCNKSQVLRTVNDKPTCVVKTCEQGCLSAESCIRTQYGNYCQRNDTLDKNNTFSQCSGSVLEKWDGKAWSKQYCAAGCNEKDKICNKLSTYPGSPKNGDTYCKDGKTVEKYTGSSWTKTSPCSYGCEIGSDHCNEVDEGQISNKCEGRYLVQYKGRVSILNKDCGKPGCNSKATPNVCYSAPQETSEDEKPNKPVTHPSKSACLTAGCPVSQSCQPVGGSNNSAYECRYDSTLKGTSGKYVDGHKCSSLSDCQTNCESSYTTARIKTTGSAGEQTIYICGTNNSAESSIKVNNLVGGGKTYTLTSNTVSSGNDSLAVVTGGPGYKDNPTGKQTGGTTNNLNNCRWGGQPTTVRSSETVYKCYYQNGTFSPTTKDSQTPENANPPSSTLKVVNPNGQVGGMVAGGPTQCKYEGGEYYNGSYLCPDANGNVTKPTATKSNDGDCEKSILWGVVTFGDDSKCTSGKCTRKEGKDGKRAWLCVPPMGPALPPNSAQNQDYRDGSLTGHNSSNNSFNLSNDPDAAPQNSSVSDGKAACTPGDKSSYDPKTEMCVYREGKWTIIDIPKIVGSGPAGNGDNPSINLISQNSAELGGTPIATVDDCCLTYKNGVCTKYGKKELTFSIAGCGPTAVANICNKMAGGGFDPKDLLNLYNRNSWTCTGTSMDQNLSALTKACNLGNQQTYDKTQGMGSIGEFTNPGDSIIFGIRAGYDKPNLGHFTAMTNCQPAGNDTTTCDLLDSLLQKPGTEYSCTLTNSTARAICKDVRGVEQDIVIDTGNTSQFDGQVVIIKPPVTL